MSAGGPRFSVVLPTHNRADVLGFAVESVLAQTEKNFELLLVADGCTDNTRAVVGAFRDERIRFFDLPKAPNFGYANRNIALREARGRLVAFAAHDDLLLPDHLERMGALLDRTGAAWAYSRPLWVSTDGYIVPFGTNLGLSDEFRDFYEGDNTIPAACIIHTREALQRAGFWPEEAPEGGDRLLWRKMLADHPGRHAWLTEPTNLHFSASWKNSRHANSLQVATILELAETAAWWPRILRHPSVPGCEQGTIWRAMQEGGSAWPGELRAATDLVINRIAWMAVKEFLPRLRQSGEELAVTRAAALSQDVLIAQLRQENDEATTRGALALAEQEAIVRSRSWRLTRPLRELSRWMSRGH